VHALDPARTLRAAKSANVGTAIGALVVLIVAGVAATLLF